MVCFMSRVYLIALLILMFNLPSFGQILIIHDNGETHDLSGGVGELIFLYRNIYGHYPSDKNILYDFLMERSDYVHEVYNLDSLITNYFALRDSAIVEQIKDSQNVYKVSGDTCSFFIAKYDCTVRCIGGTNELQKYDYDRFRSWTRSHFFDRNGKFLWQLSSTSPSIPREVNLRFRYVVTMEPRILHEDRHEIYPINWEWETEPVLLSITITRSGALSYKFPRLEGVQLYYQELGKPFLLENALGKIRIEDAINPDHLDAIKVYMKSFLDQHEEVDRMELWELVLFKNPPDLTAKQ